MAQSQDQHSFLVLPENKLAVTAVSSLGPTVRRRFTPFVTLSGPPGVGKSHLARDLARSWRTHPKRHQIHHITATEFAAQFAEASQAKTIAQFQKRYRNDVKLLICEDVQSLSGRTESQQQLTVAVDDILSQGGCVLFTSTVMPGEIPRLNRRLLNRIRGGVCVGMELPGEKSRFKLLKHFLGWESIRLSDTELKLIAAEPSFTPRELVALLVRLRAEQSLRRQLTDGDIASVLSEFSVRPDISLSQIAKATAKQFQVKIADMKSPRRSQTIVTARQVAMYLGRELGKLGLKEVGTYFNRRNHSTVIHACKKIEEGMEQDSRLALDVATIRKSLRS